MQKFHIDEKAQIEKSGAIFSFANAEAIRCSDARQADTL
jgi:hypothetical protein